MRRFLPVFLAVFGSIAATAVMVVLARTGTSWPRSIRATDWRRIIGTPPDEETVSVEAPAE